MYHFFCLFFLIAAGLWLLLSGTSLLEGDGKGGVKSRRMNLKEYMSIVLIPIMIFCILAYVLH